MMFNLNKEIDEIRLEYYISHTVEDGFIEITLNEITTLLNVSKSKAQRLIDKFINLGLLEVIEKSNSKNKKTRYRYITRVTDTNMDTVQTSNINSLSNNEDTDEDNYNKLLRLYGYCYGIKPAEINSVMKKELKRYESVDLELFIYLINSFKSNPDIKNKDRYLLKTLENIKDNNIKDLNGYFRFNKEYTERKKKSDNRKNWNYSTESSVEEDFNTMAKMTRYR